VLKWQDAIDAVYWHLLQGRDVRLLFVAAIHDYGTNAQKGRLYFEWFFLLPCDKLYVCGG